MIHLKICRFCRNFANVGQISIHGLEQYALDVRQRKFPVSGEHTYAMVQGEEELFQEWITARKVKMSNSI